MSADVRRRKRRFCVDCDGWASATSSSSARRCSCCRGWRTARCRRCGGTTPGSNFPARRRPNVGTTPSSTPSPEPRGRKRRSTRSWSWKRRKEMVNDWDQLQNWLNSSYFSMRYSRFKVWLLVKGFFRPRVASNREFSKGWSESWMKEPREEYIF